MERVPTPCHAVLIALCVCILTPAVPADARADRSVELKDWEYRWGAVRDGRPETPGEAEGGRWFRAGLPLDPPGRNGGEILWLRTRLPVWTGTEPSVFLAGVHHDFEAFHDGKAVYRWGAPVPGARHRYLGIPWHIVPLDGRGGGTFLVRTHSTYAHIGIAGIPLIDARSGHLGRIVRENLWRVAVSFLFAAAGLFAILLFAGRREETAIAAFGATLILMAVWNIAESRIKQVVFDAPIFWLYAEHASLYLAPVAIGFFVERLFGPGPGRVVRRGWQVHLVYALAALGASIADPAWLREWTLRPFQVLMALYLAVVCAVIVLEARRGDLDARIAAGGIAVAIVLGIHDIVISFLGLGFTRSKISYWGLLVFLVMLGIALDRRIRVSPAKLVQFRSGREPHAHRRVEITAETRDRLDRAIEYMKEHRTEDVSREGLAARAGMNHDYFGKMFRLYTGKRVGAYMNELRVRMAAERLAGSDQPIAGVAFDAGFESLATFYRVFQAVTGLTPTAYRERFGKKSE